MDLSNVLKPLQENEIELFVSRCEKFKVTAHPVIHSRHGVYITNGEENLSDLFLAFPQYSVDSEKYRKQSILNQFAKVYK